MAPPPKLPPGPRILLRRKKSYTNRTVGYYDESSSRSLDVSVESWNDFHDKQNSLGDSFNSSSEFQYDDEDTQDTRRANHPNMRRFLFGQGYSRRSVFRHESEEDDELPTRNSITRGISERSLGSSISSLDSFGRNNSFYQKRNSKNLGRPKRGKKFGH